MSFRKETIQLNIPSFHLKEDLQLQPVTLLKTLRHMKYQRQEIGLLDDPLCDHIMTELEKIIFKNEISKN